MPRALCDNPAMHESPLFVKVHDLLVWLIPITLKFPREHRFVITQQVQQTAFELQARLLDARHGLNPAVSLRRAGSTNPHAARRLLDQRSRQRALFVPQQEST